MHAYCGYALIILTALTQNVHILVLLLLVILLTSFFQLCLRQNSKFLFPRFTLLLKNLFARKEEPGLYKYKNLISNLIMTLTCISAVNSNKNNVHMLNQN